MDPRVSLTLYLINEHNTAVPFRLTDACKYLGLSESYLLRLFHEEVGKTLRQYLLEVRMKKAAQLLMVYQTPIKQIASECGYRDISNFYRDFRNVHAITPKKLRLRALADIARRTTDYRPGFPQ